MELFRLYKHKNFIDVAILPIEIEEKENELVVSFNWYNVVNKPTDIGVNEIYTIKKKDLKDWKLYERN